jgi:CBS domain-containing protein
MKARDVMTRNVVMTAPDASVVDALQLLLQHNISGLPVVDRSDNVVGIVTEGDFRYDTNLITVFIDCMDGEGSKFLRL